MSTRGLYGFRKNGKDKTTYNHSDSYPDYLGRNIAAFCAENTIETMNRIYDSIEIIDENTIPTKEESEWCVAAGLCDLSVNSMSEWDWCCLLRNLQGDLKKLKELVFSKGKAYMSDGQGFIKNSLFCEYAYIINLDTEMLEFWVGWQQEPQPGNRYGEELTGGRYPDRGYYPCRLAAEFPLAKIFSTDSAAKFPHVNIFNPDQVVEKMKAAEDESGERFPVPESFLGLLYGLGWKVDGYTKTGEVIIGQYSSNGEKITICGPVDDFPRAVSDYLEAFDVDAHVESWIEAKKNGVEGVPSVRELVRDAEGIKSMVKDLAYYMREY